LYIYALAALIGFASADIGILSVRDQFLPRTPPPAKRANVRPPRMVNRDSWGPITTRNIFNADGKIPDPLGGTGDKSIDAPPIPGTLGFNLVGTIVHANPAKSVASVSLRGKTDPDAFMPNAEIKDGPSPIAKMFKIERNKATYRNLQTGRLEFIEIKDDAKISFAGAPPPKVSDEPIQRLSDTEVKVKRDEINKKLADLPSLLMQARAVPRMGPDGRVQCFQMVGIQPGSAYESLGIKVGDCIKTVNGEPIDSPAKAMELFNQLKNSASIRLGVERNGRDETMNYDVE
jgi:general secretion pathway protein C